MTSYAGDNFGMGESDEGEGAHSRGARGTGTSKAVRSKKSAKASSTTPWHLTLRCDAPVEFHNQEGGGARASPSRSRPCATGVSTRG